MCYTQCKFLHSDRCSLPLIHKNKQSEGKVHEYLKIQEGQNIYTTRMKSDHRKSAVIFLRQHFTWRTKKKSAMKSEIILKMFCNCLPGLSHGY